MREPYYLCGGLQDAGSSCGPSATRAQGIYLSDWFNLSGGDGYHTQQDPTNYRNIYSESQPDRQGGNIGRSDAETRQRTSIRPSKANITNWDEYITPDMEKKAEAANWGVQPQQMGPLRYNWSTPFILSPHNPKAIMIGSNHLIMSLDGGQTYRLISPDLTQNDPERTSRFSGGMTPDENPGGGAEYHATIITISESILTSGRNAGFAFSSMFMRSCACAALSSSLRSSEARPSIWSVRGVLRVPTVNAACGCACMAAYFLLSILVTKYTLKSSSAM